MADAVTLTRTLTRTLTLARTLAPAVSLTLPPSLPMAHAGLSPDDAFEMLLVSRQEAWHVSTPLLPFSKPPVGVGDLTSALFLAALLHGKTPRAALEHTASAYHAVMAVTSESDEYELQLVAAQDHLVDPPRWFEARPLPEA